MNQFKIILILVSLNVFSLLASANSEVSIQVTLNPMGSFKATTSDIKGVAKKNGDKVVAENIIVNLKSIKTGIELRDKHTQKHLQTDQYPEAILIKAVGQNGNGLGKFKIKGIELTVKGKYEIKGQTLKANFPIRLKDLKIDDINYMGVGVEDEVQVQVELPLQTNP